MIKRLAAKAAACVVFALMLATLYAGAALAQAAATASGSTVDLSGLLSEALQAIMLAVLTVAGWFMNKHVKNADARNVMLNVLGKALAYGMNKVEGAVPGRVLTVDVGSVVVANAVNYVQQFAPQAAAHFGLDKVALTKMLWSRLPAVDGAVSDDTFKAIVAMSEGNGAAPSMSELSAALVPAIKAALEELLAKHRAEQPAG